MDIPPTVQAGGLRKRFGRHTALHDVSLTAGRGTVTGFLGANGAGKSTTLRILTGLVRADGGTATICGRAYRDHPRPTCVVGSVLEPNTADPALTGVDHLRVYARLGGHAPERVDAVVDRLGLARYVTRRVGGWSTGMRQRLMLATALLGDPKVLLLDEPTNGLDPLGIAELLDHLRRFADDGGTVVVSTHVLHEVEALLDAAVIIADGRTVAAGDLDVLRNEVGADSLAEVYRMATRTTGALTGGRAA